MTQPTSGYDYGDQSYYPRWKVRLIIRFAEFGQFAQLQATTPPKPARSLNGTDLTRGNLSFAQDPSAPAGVTRYLLQTSGGSTTAGGPQGQTTSSDGLTQVIEGVVPKEFKWTQNGLRTPDALEITLRLIDCPIDPRTVRSMAVEFYLGTVSAAEAAAQAANASAGTSAGTGSGGTSTQPLDLLPDTYTDAGGNPRTNLRFQGWVDVWTNEWSGEAEPIIRLECTDNARLLLNLQAPTKAVVAANLPIDQAFAKYLTGFPTLAGMAVEYRPPGMTPPVLQAVLAKSAFRPGLGPPVARTAGAGQEKFSVFDYLTDIAGSLGHSLFVDGTTLVIQRARTLTSDNVQGRTDDPYKGRTLPDGTQLPNRRMLYGRNVKRMQVKRNFTKNAPVNISIRAYNPEQKQVLVERFPLPADAQVYATPGDNSDNKWLELKMPGGIIDRPTMRIYAQEVYEQMGRQEIQWEVETENFASFGGGNDDPDLLDMKFGDALEILTTQDEMYSTVTSTQKALDAVAANSQRLQDLGFDKAFAGAYAKAYTDAGFPTLYRVHQLEVSGEAGDGDGDNPVTFRIHVGNYIAVTSDKSLAPGEEPPAAAQTTKNTTGGNAPPTSGPTP